MSFQWSICLFVYLHLPASVYQPVRLCSRADWFLSRHTYVDQSFKTIADVGAIMFISERLCFEMTWILLLLLFLLLLLYKCVAIISASINCDQIDESVWHCVAWCKHVWMRVGDYSLCRSNCRYINYCNVGHRSELSI